MLKKFLMIGAFLLVCCILFVSCSSNGKETEKNTSSDTDTGVKGTDMPTGMNVPTEPEHTIDYPFDTPDYPSNGVIDTEKRIISLTVEITSFSSVTTTVYNDEDIVAAAAHYVNYFSLENPIEGFYLPLGSSVLICFLYEDGTTEKIRQYSEGTIYIYSLEKKFSFDDDENHVRYKKLMHLLGAGFP